MNLAEFAIRNRTVTLVLTFVLLGVMFLKAPEAGVQAKDPYGGRFYQAYEGLLRSWIRLRWLTMGAVVGLFAVALWGFGYVDQSFFPSSTRPQFIADFWLPQGTHIDETVREAESIEEYLLEQEGVTHVSSLLGQGGLRFLLTYTPEKLNSAYAQFLVDVDDHGKIDAMAPAIESYLGERYPHALAYVSKFQLGPGSTGKIQARLSGSDPDLLRKLASRIEGIMHDDPNAKSIRTDWRQRVKVVRPQLAEEEANLNGIQRTDVAKALLEGFEGATVGVYREGDKLLPIVLRAEERGQTDVASMRNLQIWSPAAEAMIPLLPDAFFVSMAVTIIAGLLFATVLTMVVVPVLYAIFFRVPSEPPPTPLP